MLDVDGEEVGAVGEELEEEAGEKGVEVAVTGRDEWEECGEGDE